MKRMKERSFLKIQDIQDEKKGDEKKDVKKKKGKKKKFENRKNS